MITSAVIPVGGLGTRLLPATRSQPKEMLPIVDKPVVQYVVEELAAAGVQRILFVTGRRKRAIEDHFDADPELERALGRNATPRIGVQILYTRQPRPGGLGDALRYAQGFAGDGGVVVALGDSIISRSGDAFASACNGVSSLAASSTGGSPGIVARLVQAYESADTVSATLAVREVPSDLVSSYGIAILGGPAGATGAFEVLDVIEKPDPDQVSSRVAVMGRYVLGPSAFEVLGETTADASGEVQLADALRILLGRRERVLAVPLAPEERRYDIGTVEGYCAAFIEHAFTDPRLGPSLRARASALLDDA